MDDVYVYTVDDLGQVVQSGKAERQAAVVESQAIIDRHVRDFSDWLQARSAVPTIEVMCSRAQELAQKDLQIAKRHLKNGADIDKTLDRFAHDLVKKLLHDNLTLLKDAQHLSSAERDHLCQAFKRFYLERKR